ncbi:MAG: 23S rRNA (uracil(1939)-C(5))-methyltransferase RlmD [Acidobacteriia bacterium]|nr:23S rRNA (uracil(1939)-C(5))-methyltransferase RlmD [Terriglobia bacterium]
MPLTIEKLIYGGDGLARLPADERGRGKAVFVPFVLAGEKIEAALTEQKPGFARARVETIVEASPHRIQPGCPHFAACGGCHYQHASYEHQLEIKKEILRENLRRMAKLELACEIEMHPSPPWNYRNRSRLQVQGRPEFVAGYFKLASHELLPVEECPISSPLINRGIAALWQTGRAGMVAEGIYEVEFSSNAEDTQLLVEVSCSAAARRAAVKAWAEELRALLPEIAGVAAFREAQARAPSKQPDEFLVSLGEQHLTYKTQSASYRVSAGAFFQTNRYLTDELVKIVTQGRSGELVLDLYAGVGLFSTVLVRDFRHVVSVEASQTAASDLKYNLPSNGEVIQATTEQYLGHSLSKGWSGKGTVLPHKPDLAVVDPPRSGLGESVARSLASVGAPRITYVACDPATLARDLVPLLGAGYRVERAHLVDLFPQTYHLETVLHLVR